MGSAAPAWFVSVQSGGDGGASSAPAASCVRIVASSNVKAMAVGNMDVPRAALGGSRGAGVLERPKLDQSGSDNTPMTEEGVKHCSLPL